MAVDVPFTAVECLKCKTVTKHEILHETKTSWALAEYQIRGWQIYSVVRCRGCTSVTFMLTSGDTDDTDENGMPRDKVTLFPSRNNLEPVNGQNNFPMKVGGIYRETLVALSNGAPTLAAAGIRAIVEAICQDKKASGRDLERRIDWLVQDGFLSAGQAEFLHLQRFLGNLAIHEIQPPEPAELRAALSIVETMLTTIYTLPRTAMRMRRSKAELTRRKNRHASGETKTDED